MTRRPTSRRPPEHPHRSAMHPYSRSSHGNQKGRRRRHAQLPERPWARSSTSSWLHESLVQGVNRSAVLQGGGDRVRPRCTRDRTVSLSPKVRTINKCPSSQGATTVPEDPTKPFPAKLLASCSLCVRKHTIIRVCNTLRTSLAYTQGLPP